jgi:N-acetylglutamate synthase-like GNAT family acetyltransferase
MDGIHSGLRIINLRDAPDMTETAANWFYSKWWIPLKTYQDSMIASQNPSCTIPQWYVVVDEQRQIIAGLGLIENDFHPRMDLTPNVCAVFVEESCRNKGIAKAMLDYVLKDAARFGIKKLYLLTDHIGFYEKCGWKYVCTIDDDRGEASRVYEANCIIKS